MKKKIFGLGHAEARRRAHQAIDEASDSEFLEIRPGTRSLEQNAKFHAIIEDISKSGMVFAGKPRTAAQWKAIIVSAHAEATKEPNELVIGIEGELINLRESTAQMSKARGSSLIEYALAFCAMNGINTAC